MAVVHGIKERIQGPLYDSLAIPPEQQLREVNGSNIFKFFVDVQGKTKLETNLQSAALLPHYNTFEARAMRVVISDLRPEFSEDPVTEGEAAEEFEVTDADGVPLAGPIEGTDPVIQGENVSANLEMSLKRVMELLDEARASIDRQVVLAADDEEGDVKLFDGTTAIDAQPNIDAIAAVGDIVLTIPDLEALAQSVDKESPPLEQIRLNDGAGTIVSQIIFNTVTSLFVGDKEMIKMPTWFFPGGAGPFTGAKSTIHGEPDPMATFRFAEAVNIDKNQNFRVEIEVPDSRVLKEIQKIYGPLFIWVVLDGYLTRDVQ